MTAATRNEFDSFGAIDVPADRYWGAQTERARRHFAIGEERMPTPLIRAYALQKQASALANRALGTLEPGLADAIVAACEEIRRGDLDAHFPLVVWQTGSGTQTNMNLNEVIAARANEMLGASPDARMPIHPNDHVNLGQSSNDSFPTAMHVAAALELRDRLLPALDALERALRAKAEAFAATLKIGRTHLQDAVPMTLGQEFGAWASQVADARGRVAESLPGLCAVAQGGTAVGTGLNAHPRFAATFCAELLRLTLLPFRSAADRFAALAGHDALVACSGDLNVLATALMKLGNDIRLLASGPRAGLAELRLPENEPGSSIMPGKVNPTQAEALTMVAAQVMGNHVTITIAGASGHLQLNVFKPVIIYNLLQSIRLLADATRSFTQHCVLGIEADAARLEATMRRSLMLVTALAPHIGYDAAARIARHAHATGATLREAALALGAVSAAEFDRWVDPAAMLGPT
jgi:fumarate hydratase class II